MKISNRAVAIFALLVFGCGVIFAITSAHVGHRVSVYAFHWFVVAQEKKILYRTDYHLVASELRKFGTAQGWSADSNGYPRHFSGNDVAIPKPLRQLGPTAIWLFNDHVEMQFGGPLASFGIAVFPEGVEGTGDKKLDRGIWFYSDNGKVP